MNYFSRNIFKYSNFAFLVCAVFFLPRISQAATNISFDPQERTVGTDTSFIVGINISSDVDINTISAQITIPQQFELVGTSDGNSIINMWIDRPHLNAGHKLQFAGIVPGGFKGKGGRLVLVALKATQPGMFSISLDPSSQVYANTPLSEAEQVSADPIQLSIARGRDNIANDIPDTDPPEPFLPTVFSLPTGAGSHWAVDFSTVDKVVGINHYEIAESYDSIDVTNNIATSSLSWRTVDSPYILADQSLSSYVYIRAVDNNGNARIESISPQYSSPWHLRPRTYILIALLLIVLSWYAIHTYKTSRK